MRQLVILKLMNVFQLLITNDGSLNLTCIYPCPGMALYLQVGRETAF